MKFWRYSTKEDIFNIVTGSPSISFKTAGEYSGVMIIVYFALILSLCVLSLFEFTVDNFELVALASSRSKGSSIEFGENKTIVVGDLAEYDFSGTDIAIFSPGAKISSEFAPKAAKQGCIVIDNTSHFRTDPDVPLVVAEVNPEAIKNFSRYRKPEIDGDPLPEPAYDVLILAGQPDFILRTAPVLAFYDLDPERVTYLGTDLWTRADLASEPSLQGSIITQASLPPSGGFEKHWQSVFNKPSNTLVRLGFDAFALIALTKQEMTQKVTKSASTQMRPKDIDWRASLIRQQGFQGFSGQFNLLPDGRNQREYELFQISNNKISSFQP